MLAVKDAWKDAKFCLCVVVLKSRGASKALNDLLSEANTPMDLDTHSSCTRSVLLALSCGPEVQGICQSSPPVKPAEIYRCTGLLGLSVYGSVCVRVCLCMCLCTRLYDLFSSLSCLPDILQRMYSLHVIS